MSVIFKTTDTDEAAVFGGHGKTIIRVCVPNNGDWITGAVVKLQWKSKFPDDDDDVYYDEDVEWTKPGPQVVYLVAKNDYKLHSTHAGFHAWEEHIIDDVK